MINTGKERRKFWFWQIILSLLIIGIFILATYGVVMQTIIKSEDHILDRNEKIAAPHISKVDSLKLDTLYVPVEKVDNLFRRQVQTYDFTIKVVIGVFSIFLTLFIFLLGLSAILVYRDRKEMREDMEQRLKDAIDEAKRDAKKDSEENLRSLDSYLDVGKKVTEKLKQSEASANNILIQMQDLYKQMSELLGNARGQNEGRNREE